MELQQRKGKGTIRWLTDSLLRRGAAARLSFLRSSVIECKMLAIRFRLIVVVQDGRIVCC